MPNTPIVSIQQLAQADNPINKKLAWRMLRQFASAEELQAEFNCKLEFELHATKQLESKESTKLLLETSEHQRLETVALFPSAAQRSTSASIIPHGKLPRATACVSSQPGCGVGCPFCTTGELGYRGNLAGTQIAEQVYWAGLAARSHGRRLRNVVYMGMGEPLHNLDNVLQSLSILTHEELFGLPQRRITVSTVGVARAMKKLASDYPEVNLALSLHAAEPELRKLLVPRALGDLDSLRAAISEVNRLQPKKAVWLEVVLFQELNDLPEHAELLVAFCRGLRVEVNLIPYNPAAAADRFSPSSRQRRERFANILRRAGLRASLRNSFGSDQQSACGQLGAPVRNVDGTL